MPGILYWTVCGRALLAFISVLSLICLALSRVHPSSEDNLSFQVTESSLGEGEEMSWGASSGEDWGKNLLLHPAGVHLNYWQHLWDKRYSWKCKWPRYIKSGVWLGRVCCSCVCSHLVVTLMMAQATNDALFGRKIKGGEKASGTRGFPETKEESFISGIRNLRCCLIRWWCLYQLLARGKAGRR